MKLIVAITGASGANYAISLLKALKEKKIETYLIVSEWAEKIVKQETGLELAEVKSLALHYFKPNDFEAAIASSSFLVDGMVVIPCSVKTAAEIASANCSNLISRAADNMLKTRKKLVVCLRETPLSAPCLENLHKIALAGGIIFPLSPGFYHQPKELKDLSAFITGKLLDLFGIENNAFKRWGN